MLWILVALAGCGGGVSADAAEPVEDAAAMFERANKLTRIGYALSGCEVDGTGSPALYPGETPPWTTCEEVYAAACGMGPEGARLMIPTQVLEQAPCGNFETKGLPEEHALKIHLQACQIAGWPSGHKPHKTCADVLAATCAMGEPGKVMLKELEIPAMCEG